MRTVVTLEVVILLVIVFAAIGVDLWLNFTKPTGRTFSALSRAWARSNPFWPWMWGLLAGRFFHWGEQPILDDPMGTIGALVITFCVVVFFSWDKVWAPIRSTIGIPGAFLLGYLVGSLFWPVKVAAIRFIM
jgi:hypothetical protein